MAQNITAIEINGTTYTRNCDGSITVDFETGKQMIINSANNDADWDAIVNGDADPVADGWEDGCGNVICQDEE